MFRLSSYSEFRIPTEAIGGLNYRRCRHHSCRGNSFICSIYPGCRYFKSTSPHSLRGAKCMSVISQDKTTHVEEWLRRTCAEASIVSTRRICLQLLVSQTPLWRWLAVEAYRVVKPQVAFTPQPLGAPSYDIA